MGADVILQAEDLALEYRDGTRRIRAVDGVDLALARGEFVGFVGPSGSGKSSLLFLLAGLRAPDRGVVRLLGTLMPRRADESASLRRRHVGFLFQEPFLVPYLDVRENALVHTTDRLAEDRLNRLAQAVGMESMLTERPHRLSGGERQRAGLLRALVAAPDLVLADEPTGNLDSATGGAVMEVLRESTREAALLVVTHDESMLAGADRVLRLVDGRLEVVD